MKIHIPNSAFIGNIDSFLKQIDFSGPDQLEVTTNENWISVHPVVLSMVAVLGLSARPDSIRVDPITAKSGHYLERMGLFKLLGIRSGMNIKEHEPAGRFIPLTQVRTSQELTQFITEMIPLLHLEPKQVDAIRYVVSELVRNVLEHSQSRIGAIVCAQYHKKSNMIRIGIADTGIGIKQSINQSHVAEAHIDAIRLALMPGITGTTSREGGTEFNAGAGLFFIRSIAKVKRNFFMVFSGDAMYKLLKGTTTRLYADPFKDNHSKSEGLPSWKGTVVGIDISLDDTAEFSTLLELIREVYAKTVRERRKERFRKPRFI